MIDIKTHEMLWTLNTKLRVASATAKFRTFCNNLKYATLPISNMFLIYIKECHENFKEFRVVSLIFSILKEFDANSLKKPQSLDNSLGVP